MRLIGKITFLIGLLCGSATSLSAVESFNAGRSFQIKGGLQNILYDNDIYVKSRGSLFFQNFLTSQSPTGTVVGCSDSRFHINAIDQTPENDLFVVRNIGNNVAYNIGSVLYGVDHLKTPLLLVVGHDGCGAVKAASLAQIDNGNATWDDGLELEDSVKEELTKILLINKKIGPDADTIQSGTPGYFALTDVSNDADQFQKNVEANVHNQIAYIFSVANSDPNLEELKGLIDDNKLLIVGGVFDLQNYYRNKSDPQKDEYGKLKIINVNGAVVYPNAANLDPNNVTDINTLLDNAPQAAIDKLDEIQNDNVVYVNTKGESFFDSFLSKQVPRNTIVGCSDSRFHMHAIDQTPENDLFVIRNIGNNTINSLGSVTYGIKHLNAPIITVIGHDNCGAVKAASLAQINAGEASWDSGLELEESVINELKQMLLVNKKIGPDAGTITEGIKNFVLEDVSSDKEKFQHNIEANVHNQVDYIMSLADFKELIDSNNLLVIGAVFDFQNYYGDKNNIQDSGRLVILNVNGITCQKKILKFLKKMDALPNQDDSTQAQAKASFQGAIKLLNNERLLDISEGNSIFEDIKNIKDISGEIEKLVDPDNGTQQPTLIQSLNHIFLKIQEKP